MCSAPKSSSAHRALWRLQCTVMLSRVGAPPWANGTRWWNSRWCFEPQRRPVAPTYVQEASSRRQTALRREAGRWRSLLSAVSGDGAGEVFTEEEIGSGPEPAFAGLARTLAGWVGFVGRARFFGALDEPTFRRSQTWRASRIASRRTSSSFPFGATWLSAAFIAWSVSTNSLPTLM